MCKAVLTTQNNDKFGCYNGEKSKPKCWRTCKSEKGCTWSYELGARTGIALTARDHLSVGYRVPGEWATLTEAQRGMGSLGALKRGSRAGFLEGYGGFVCRDLKCKVCLSGLG